MLSVAAVGAIFALVCGLVDGLVGGLTDKVKAGKALPNQGIKLSRNNSLAVFLVTVLSCGLICLLISGLIAGLSGTRLIDWLTLGRVVGLPVASNRGGSAQALRATTDSLVERKYAIQVNQIPRSVRQADSSEESGRRLHLQPPDATRLLC
jgi:hypothetical protein